MRILTYTVLPEEDGRQIKRIIRGKMGVSHRVFSELKQRGGFVLDGRAVFANHVVRAGQVIRLELFDEESGKAAQDDAPVNVVYEDDDIIVINKEAPLACQSSEKQPENTLENRLMYRYRNQNFVFRPVNRLDKGTSGLMVATKHAHAQNILQEQLHTDSYVREYLAVVCGCPEPAEGEINAPIRKAEGATVRREVGEGGKESLTRYRVIERGEEFSLVRLRLLTGRTHQIRVHMSHIGHPVAGDFLYGTEDERLSGRFALHSHYLSILHPMTGERMEFIAPLPVKLLGILKGWRLTQACAEDAGEILSLYRLAAQDEHSHWNEEYPAMEEIEFDLSQDGLFVLRQAGRIIAAVSKIAHDDLDDEPLGWSDGKSCVLARLCVHPEYRGRGIGEWMVRAAMDKSAGQGLEWMRLLADEHNGAARRIYEKIGFVQKGEVNLYGGHFVGYEGRIPAVPAYSVRMSNENT